MSEFEQDTTLRSVLIEAAKSGLRLRFFGRRMCILAEGFIAHVGKDVVAIRHRDDQEPDEYLLIERIVKVQKIGEYRNY